MRIITLLTPLLPYTADGGRTWVFAHVHTNAPPEADSRAARAPHPAGPSAPVPGPACDQTCFCKWASWNPDSEMMSGFQPRPAGIEDLGLKSHPPPHWATALTWPGGISWWVASRLDHWHKDCQPCKWNFQKPAGELEEGGQKPQTSSYKISKS